MLNEKAKSIALRPPVIGAALGLTLVLGSIVVSCKSLFALFSIEGLVIVIGGVIAVAFMSYPKADVRDALAAVAALYREDGIKPDNLHKDMLQLLRWARLIKEKGMRALEESIAAGNVGDSSIKYGLNMVVSGYDCADIRAMMETSADATYERDLIPVDILDAMTSHAPAFGMVGTLIGMVMMLGQLGDDHNMASIGSSLAISFLSTLYGVLTARMVYMPAATRLRQEVEQRRFRQQFIVEGLVLLAGGKTAMVIQDRLNCFLRPEKRDYFNVFKAAPERPHSPVRLFKKAANA